MRVGVLGGRAVIVRDDRAIDVQEASGGRFGPDPMDLYGRWGELAVWASDLQGDVGVEFAETDLGCPVPRPRQVFAIGLNYHDHAAESAAEAPSAPMVFTKFPSAIAGPFADVPLVAGSCDWEVELVVVIGRGGRDIGRHDVAAHIAGFTVGQDVSEREVQLAGANPQFSLAKSHRNFAPVGPVVVSLDEFDDPGNLAIECRRNDVVEQAARTDQLIHDVPRVVGYVSSFCELYPGDLFFTGTPAGVGMGKSPPQYLAQGDVVVSTIEAIGSLRNRIV